MDRNSLIGWTLMGVLMVAMMYIMNQQRVETLPADNKTGQSSSPYESDTALNGAVEIGDTSAGAPGLEPAFTEGEDPAVRDSIREIEAARRYGAFSKYLSADEEELVIENDVLLIRFSNHGGIPHEVILKDYKTWDDQPLAVFTADGGEIDVSFSAYTVDGQTAGFHTKDIYFDAVREDGPEGSTIVRYRMDLGDGKYYEHEYIIPASGYLVNFNLKTAGFDDVIYNRQDFFSIALKQRFESLEHNIQTERMYSTLSFADANYGVDKIGLRKSAEKDLDYSLKWISFKQKFFSTVLITDKAFAAARKVSVDVPEHKDHVKDLSAELIVEYESGGSFNFPMQIYFGPNKYKTLKAMDINLHKTMQLGTSIIRWVNIGIIIPMFNFLSRFTHNYGLIIILLTLFIKIIIFPFTYKSYLSMIKMRVLQPELTELREKFGKDQQKMGAAQMDLYRKAGVNPLGGCLPMLFQFPILVAMYRFFPASIELRQESFLWATDLSTYDSIFSWSRHIPFLSDIYGNHISLFTILMAITSYFYTKQNSMNMPTADPNNIMAQQMKIFMYIMPFMLLFIFNKFSAALTFYYFLFNLMSVIQQEAMKRFLIDEDKIHAEIQANKQKVRKKSKWQIRMEEMMKQQQEVQKKRKG